MDTRMGVLRGATLRTSYQSLWLWCGEQTSEVTADGPEREVNDGTHTANRRGQSQTFTLDVRPDSSRKPPPGPNINKQVTEPEKDTCNLAFRFSIIGSCA